MFTFFVNLFTCILLIGDGDLRLSLFEASDLDDRDEVEDEEEDTEESEEVDGEEDEVDELDVDDEDLDDDRDLLEDLSRLRLLTLRAIFLPIINNVLW